MKLRSALASLLPLVVLACHGAGPGAPEVLCELLGLESAGEDQATATFRVTNRGPAEFVFQGYSVDAPLYACEVEEAGRWQRSPLGWCGTGLAEQSLAPGRSLEFSASLPRDGRRYRFELGSPAVRTPEVSAER